MAESTAGFRLVSITRKMIKQKAQSTDVADCVYGTVLSVAPLSVQLDTRTTLQEAQLVVGALCKETIIKIPFPEKGQIKHKHQQFTMVCTIRRWNCLKFNCGEV